jgi:hypothetical protein
VGVAVGDVAVGSGALGSGAVAVARGGAVMANTTAPSSLMTGGAGALTRVQIPQPNPVRMSTMPRINIPRDRAGTNLRISSKSISVAEIGTPCDRAGGIFALPCDPIPIASPCQVKLDYGIIGSVLVRDARGWVSPTCYTTRRDSIANSSCSRILLRG